MGMDEDTVNLDTLNGVTSGHPEANEDESKPMSPSASYRQGDEGQNCAGCVFFDDDMCAVWNATVESTGVCNSYESHHDADPDGDQGNGIGMSERLGELYCTDGSVDKNEDGLIWKTVLRTGTWRYRPGAGQKPIPKPLHVVSGHSSNPRSVLGMADIVKSFEDGAIEHVTVPLSHADRVDENTGYVRQLKIEPDPDRQGESVLRAGIEFTEEDIKRKVENRSIANTSVGLFYDYIRKDDGQKFSLAMKHIALTNSPWINGMRPFGMSEDTEVEVESLEFDSKTGDEAPEPTAASADNKTTKRYHMALPSELDGLDLADDAAAKVLELLRAKDAEAEAARQEAETLRTQNVELSEKQREAAVESRIGELKELGLSEQPGFLKVVREVLLADDGEKTLSLSEDGKEEEITFSDVVNRLIDALPKKDGKIDFGEQAESLGTEEKPDKDASGENKSAEDRLKEASEFLYGTSIK